jgi:hypothetical protein
VYKYTANCSLCKSDILIKYKGFNAIKVHEESGKHKKHKFALKKCQLIDKFFLLRTPKKKTK